MITLPASAHVPLRGGPVLRWGVLAPGGIAGDWTTTLHAHTDQRVVAVASRSLERAQRFAATHCIERAYGGYEQLLADPGVDVVYIAAPHSEHLALGLMAIAAGKHVLIEKPIGVNAAQAREIAEAAGTASVFAMEAMWSRFLPQTTVIAQLLAADDLGDVLTVTADFGAKFDLGGRVYDPALGGGALLDIGVYPAWFAQFVLGSPLSITAKGTLAATGVDTQAAVILDHAGGAQAVITTSMLVDTPLAATISGTKARVEVDGPFLSPSSFRVLVDGAEPLQWREPHGFAWRDGLCYQATAVAQHVADGLLESPWHPLATTIAVLDVIDEARAQLGAL